MPDIEALAAQSDFAQKPWENLDWGIGLDGAKMASERPVRRRANLYRAAAASVIINEEGPVAKVRYCRKADCDVNFIAGDGLLIAKDPSARTMPESTPITLKFESPLRAVGAYVSVTGALMVNGMPIHAVMWVMVAGNWSSVWGDGILGSPLPAGSGPTAAFVGAAATGAAGIEKVCFDASVTGSFEMLVLSPLLWSA